MFMDPVGDYVKNDFAWKSALAMSHNLLFVLQQHIMFFFLLVTYCSGTYLKSPPASYVKRSIVH